METTLRTITNFDWITIILFSSVLFAVLAKTFYYTKFLNFIILPFNNKYIFMYNKKDKIFNWFNILFTAFQVINFSLFIYLAKNIFFESIYDDNPIIYLVILGFLLLFLLIKTFLQLGNGIIFNSNDTITMLIFKKMSYLNYSSLVMFLSNVILTYVLKDSKAIVYVSIFLILLINTIGWITVLKNHQKFITHNFFYFILYLCTLEFSPFVIIGSYLKD